MNQVDRVAEAIARSFATSMKEVAVHSRVWPAGFSDDAVKRYREMAVAAIEAMNR